MYEIRPAEPLDITLLPVIEAASDSLLTTIGGKPLSAPLPPGASGEEMAASLKLLVAGRPCIGFARLEEVDGGAHLEQLSVLPAHTGQGVGRSLVSASLNWARQQGYGWMSLCTFADVSFNAPFYVSCGFRVVEKPEGALAQLREHENAAGLDALGRRVAMRVEL
ncbi:GNAT family N-acetyltransferase [Arthrobacter sp. H14]|uniref:GNAT family N-acetyltransferase n=1 Tax=Arthrobacter sp. H14 TaxID=1312959 RepID=UPI0004B0D200|nr:GNAT family N-acetyltransferase [Arthrobacter sp. H14]